MSEEVEFKIKLKQETVNLIDDFIKYGKIKNRYGEYDVPDNHEAFIKAAIDYFILRLERVESFVLTERVMKLNSNKKLKNNLKKIMTEKGYKQKDLSHLANIDPGNISIVLSNRSQPSIDYFLRIWIVLGCPPIEDIFYREG